MPFGRRTTGAYPAQRSPGRRSVAQWVGQGLARLTYAVLVEPTWLEVNRLRVGIPEAPAAGALRVVHLTDFHYRRNVSAGYIEHCVSLANAERPHVVALTGDYVHKGARYVDQIARVLSGLQAPLGTFAVLGNHDHAVRTSWGLRGRRKLNERMAAALQNNGIRVLHNELIRVRHAGLVWQISGVDDLWSRCCRPQLVVEQLDSAQPHLMLAHHPRTIELMAGHRCDLMLSGHTHGGQVHSQRFGSITLSRRMKGYAAGLYQFGPQRLYVNKGVGYGWRVRYNRRPEIAVFDLSANGHCPGDNGCV